MRLNCSCILLASVIIIGCATGNNPVKSVSNRVIGQGWSRTMVNATVFRYNSVVSHNGFQYAAYYDSSATVVLAKRRHGANEWETKVTPYKGNVLDAHNSIAIMVDGNGFLHVAWDHHNNSLNYCRSVGPGSLGLTEKQLMVGKNEDKVTYPEFYRLPSGNLIFVYRDGSSGNGNLVMNRYDVKTKMWVRLHDNLIDGEGLRNAYWQMTVSRSGSIHVSWVWRETYNVETNHDMCYAVSKDEGKTWFTSDGRQYDTPILESTAEYALHIPQKSDLINQTSIASDDKDQPYIATYFQSVNDLCPQYYVIYKEKDHWKYLRVSNRSMDFDLSGMGSRSIPMARPQVLCGSFKGKTHLFMITRDDEYGSRVRLLSGRSGDAKWSSTDLTDYPLERWEPSYDTELWKEKSQLHIFLQRVGQESGEKAVEMSAQPVSILEVSLK